MNYCAVGLRTESGDDYVFLVQYLNVQDVVEYLKDQLEEEFEYISHVQVDSGMGVEQDYKIRGAIQKALELNWWKE